MGPESFRQFWKPSPMRAGSPFSGSRNGSIGRISQPQFIASGAVKYNNTSEYDTHLPLYCRRQQHLHRGCAGVTAMTQACPAGCPEAMQTQPRPGRTIRSAASDFPFPIPRHNSSALAQTALTHPLAGQPWGNPNSNLSPNPNP